MACLRVVAPTVTEPPTDYKFRGFCKSAFLFPCVSPRIETLTSTSLVKIPAESRTLSTQPESTERKILSRFSLSSLFVRKIFTLLTCIRARIFENTNWIVWAKKELAFLSRSGVYVGYDGRSKSSSLFNQGTRQSSRRTWLLESKDKEEKFGSVGILKVLTVDRSCHVSWKSMSDSQECEGRSESRRPSAANFQGRRNRPSNTANAYEVPVSPRKWQFPARLFDAHDLICPSMKLFSR